MGEEREHADDASASALVAPVCGEFYTRRATSDACVKARHSAEILILYIARSSEKEKERADSRKQCYMTGWLGAERRLSHIPPRSLDLCLVA